MCMKICIITHYHSRVHTLSFPPALPSPQVTTTMNSTATAGGQQALECNVSVVPFLSVAPTVQWVAPNNSEVASGYGPSLTHTLNPVRTSDAGQYTCQATVDILSVGVSVSAQGSTTLTVQSESLGHSGYGMCSPAPSPPPQSPSLVWPSLPTALLPCMLALASPSPVLSHWTPV